MLGSQALEVAIGVIFVYILVSVICSAVREGLEGMLKKRAVYLERGIREILHDPHGSGLAQAFYQHPLIFSLFSGGYDAKSAADMASMRATGTNLPSYVPSKSFALALMDLAARGITNEGVSGAPVTLESIRTNVRKLGNPAVQRVLLAAADTAQGDINKAQAFIESWFDSSMDRVSGWYKRWTQGILFVIGATLAVSLNVDTIAISRYLYKDDGARAVLLSQAQAAVTDTAHTIDHTDAAKKKLDSLNLPIGWEGNWTFVKPNADPWGFAAPLLGWLLTAFAATLGAPFWFDVLNKVMVIRSTVKPHEKSPEEASQDRQKPATDMPAAAPQQPVVAAPAPAPLLQAVDDDVDGCDITPNATIFTSDQDLPAAEGGVAA